MPRTSRLDSWRAYDRAPRLSTTAGGEQPRHLGVALAAGVRQRAHALAVGEVRVGAGREQQADALGVARTAVAEDDRLEQRRPPEAVDVVDLDRRLQQLPDHLDVAAIGGADQA